MLDRSLRQSWPARISAIGFILIIILGNLWLTLSLIHSAIPTWVGVAWACAIVLTLGGGVALLGLGIWRRLHPVPGSDDASDV